MAKRDKYRNKKASDFFGYTEGKLSDRERNAFERRLQKDPFGADAAEGFSRVSREEAEQDLHSAAGSIHRRIAGASSRPGSNRRIADAGNRSGRNRRIADAGSRSMRNRRIAWYSAAAAVASLMIVTTVFFRLNDNGLERFETAPEMREAAREQSAKSKSVPLEEAEEEQEKPVEEESKDQDMPVEQEEMVQDRSIQDGSVQDGSVRDGSVRDGSVRDGATFPVTAGPDAKKGYDLKEMQMHQKEQAMDQEENNLAKKLPAEAELDRQEIEEDHAFAWEKMEKEAAAGRYSETQQRMAAPKAPPEPMTDQHMEIALVPDEINLDELDEIVVIGHAISKKTNMTATVAVEEADPSGTVEYESAAPEKGLAGFRSYVDSTLVFPALTETSGKEVVVLKFSVSPDGRPQDFRVIRAPDDEAFEKEAIRVVSEGPAWQPATKNGQYIEEDVRLRIVFKKD